VQLAAVVRSQVRLDGLLSDVVPLQKIPDRSLAGAAVPDALGNGGLHLPQRRRNLQALACPMSR
jgi:hypothetical protein